MRCHFSPILASLEKERIQAIAYTDDVVIMSTTLHGRFQIGLNTPFNWTSKYGFSIRTKGNWFFLISNIR